MTSWHGRARPAQRVESSSPRPSAPSAIVNATDAIIAWKSDSRPESSAAMAFSAAASQRADAASTHASTAVRAAVSAGDSGPPASSSRRSAASLHRPSIQIRFAARRVAHWCAPSAPSSPIACKTSSVSDAAAEKKQVHRPHPEGVGRSCRRGRSGEAVSEVEIEQSHRVLRGLEAQLRIGGQIGLQREQGAAHGRLRIGVRHPLQAAAPGGRGSSTGTSRPRAPGGVRRTADGPGGP